MTATVEAPEQDRGSRSDQESVGRDPESPLSLEEVLREGKWGNKHVPQLGRCLVCQSPVTGWRRMGVGVGVTAAEVELPPPASFRHPQISLWPKLVFKIEPGFLPGTHAHISVCVHEGTNWCVSLCVCVSVQKYKLKGELEVSEDGCGLDQKEISLYLFIKLLNWSLSEWLIKCLFLLWPQSLLPVDPSSSSVPTLPCHTATPSQPCSTFSLGSIQNHITHFLFFSVF